MELRPVGLVDSTHFAPGKGQAGTQHVDSGSFKPMSGAGRNIQGAAAKRREKEDAPRSAREAQEMLSVGKRGLKFKFVEDANMYQLHVIDKSDGSVVRKVPPDEALKIIVHLKERMQAALKADNSRDQLDVFA